ncbi:hypothetical protein TNCV_3365371 [Trichonephila clavipes]|nr:hypothetical protein TNCV_3365371 [Trichonephila clavipes]
MKFPKEMKRERTCNVKNCPDTEPTFDHLFSCPAILVIIQCISDYPQDNLYSDNCMDFTEVGAELDGRIQTEGEIDSMGTTNHRRTWGRKPCSDGVNCRNSYSTCDAA